MFLSFWRNSAKQYSKVCPVATAGGATTIVVHVRSWLPQRTTSSVVVVELDQLVVVVYAGASVVSLA
jgi:hypothetical protein